jgi:peptide/nickel transport system substrate-binding protein
MKGKISIAHAAKLFFYVGILFFMGLLYWSFVLQEDRLNSIDHSLKTLQVELRAAKPSHVLSQPTEERQLDSKYPNILSSDDYVTKTLPLLLGPDFTAKGVLRMASIGVPDTLHPFNGWTHINEWISYCQGSVATEKVGFYETLAPDLALRIEERPTDRPDRASFWVHLRQDIFWQPLEQRHFPDEITLDSHFLKKTPVTAEDFKFFFDAISNPHVGLPDAVALRFLLRDIERIDVIDPHTFAVIVKKSSYKDAQGAVSYVLPYATKFYIARLSPLASFVYKYNPDGTKICEEDSGADFYRLSSLWANRFVNHFASRVIVSCGPWIFDEMNDRQIRFRRNPDYFNPNSALYNAMEVYFLETQDAIWRDFIAQKIDLCVMTPQNLSDLAQFLKSDVYAEKKQKGSQIEKLSYLMRSYTYVAWNEKKAFFKNEKVRRALTLAIDRSRLIRQNLNSEGIAITGPFFVGSEQNNPALAPYPYDPEEAKRILAEEGWFDSNGDGILDKMIDGELVPFRFRLTYFVKNPVSKANCEMIATFLREIGIDCVLNGVDIADLSNEFEDKSFDALYLAWGLSKPPEDPRQLWHSEGADEKGSSNMIGFRDKEVDRLIDELVFVTDAKERKELFHMLHEKIYQQAPYVFLFTPKSTLVWWNDVHNIFIPKDRQDILPGANVEQPTITYSWK